MNERLNDLEFIECPEETLLYILYTYVSMYYLPFWTLKVNEDWKGEKSHRQETKIGIL